MFVDAANGTQIVGEFQADVDEIVHRRHISRNDDGGYLSLLGLIL
jgi:hypothetical protein